MTHKGNRPFGVEGRPSRDHLVKNAARREQGPSDHVQRVSARRIWWRVWAWDFAVPIGSTLLAVSGTCASWAYIVSLDVAAFLIAVSLLLWLLFLLRIPYWSYGRIVPYFERPVPGRELTFRSGHTIAKDLVELDNAASRAHVRQISSFGFNDDYFGDTVLWYDAEVGLKTVTGLLAVLQADAGEIRDVGQVVAELKGIETRLQHAFAWGVRFCLLLELDPASEAPPHPSRRQSSPRRKGHL